MVIQCLPVNGISREWSRGLSLRLGLALAFGGLGLGLGFCWAVLKPSQAKPGPHNTTPYVPLISYSVAMLEEMTQEERRNPADLLWQ